MAALLCYKSQRINKKESLLRDESFNIMLVHSCATPFILFSSTINVIFRAIKHFLECLSMHMHVQVLRYTIIVLTV